jgi:hypothetical protein
MTKISQYPTLSNPTEDDILIGTDVNSSDETKNFSIGSIVNLVENGGRPYNSYTALLTQTGTSAPVATVLENTIGTITITRNGTGEYTITSSGLFTLNKTTFDITPIQGFIKQSALSNINTIVFETRSTSNVASDELLASKKLEIRVYN